MRRLLAVSSLCLAGAGGLLLSGTLAPGVAWARGPLPVKRVIPVAGATAAATKAAPAYSGGHAYRHGVVPLRGHQNVALATAISANDLNYGGGISGVGVTTGAPRVYLVFWGSQWGMEGTDSSGYATFAGDPSGMAPDLQAFFKGLGTNSETWSGVMTQYCQGVATGAQTCPASNNQHVGYPTGGALAGVWEDTSAPAPAAASGHQIGAEAVNAATHFGNTTQSSNLSAQYVIISPTGTNPDGFNQPGVNFCAWHDYTGDATLDGGGAVNSPDGFLAFTNLPYIPDAGVNCGQNFVTNPGGTLDGVTIVEGHEYAETITDTYPDGGWIDTNGGEDGDKCAWLLPGQQGAAQDISLTTGSFAVQSTWANDFNGGSGGCEVSHPIVGDVTVTSPGNQTSAVGTSVSLQIAASDSASGQTLTYSATGLPAGLSINSSSGVISGIPTTTGTSSVTVTVADTTGTSGSASFTWTVSAGPAVTTTGASVDGAGTVMLTGTVNPEALTTTYHFEYGATPAYGRATPETTAGSDTFPHVVSAAIAGLTAGTYHFRLVATNANGTAGTTDGTFAIPPPPPVATPAAPPPVVVAIAGSTVRVKHGRTKLTLICSGGAPGSSCRGTISLTERVRVRVQRRVGGQLRTVSVMKTVVLARASFSLTTGSRQSIALTVRRGALTLLAQARSHKLKATATASLPGAKPESRPITLSG
jgi:serine protease